MAILFGVLFGILISSSVHGTAISNLNLIFETFSPSSMVRFFEFNDVGWNITEKCIKDMFLYLDSLHKDILWAVKLYDAGGYYAGSIYAGNNIRQGDPDLCRHLNNQLQDYGKFNGTPSFYEELQSYLEPAAILPFPVQLVNAKYKAIIESSPFHSYIIHQTVCMPASCTHYDLTQVMSYANLSHLRSNFAMKNAELLEVRVLKDSYRFYMDMAFYWLIMLTSVFLLLGLFGTILEHFMNFDVKINLMKIEHKNAINATATQLTNRLNNLPDCQRNFAKSNLDPLKTPNLGLLQLKEFKIENVSTISMDLLSTKCNQFPSSPEEISLNIMSSNASFMRRFLLAFSWRKNCEILFSDSPKHCVNDVIEIAGLRLCSLLWILMVNVCTVLYYISGENIWDYAKLSISIDLICRQ